MNTDNNEERMEIDSIEELKKILKERVVAGTMVTITMEVAEDE